MSKESEARVRDELLQQLYGAVLRAQLTEARDRATGSSPDRRSSSKQGSGEALALCAGVCANLQPADLLLLPTRGGDGFRALRGASAGSLRMPRAEAAAVALALGAAHAHAQMASGTLVCVLLPATRSEGAGGSRSQRSQAFPQSWAAAGDYAARRSLPLLLVSDRPTMARTDPQERAAHLRPAPPYPTIPVDREDALAIYRVAFECASRARAGMGPSRIEGVPFRVRGESGPKPGSQPQALARLEAMLRRRGAFSKAWRRQLERGLLRDLAGDGSG